MNSVGYWKGHDRPHLPDPHEYVDPTWDRQERDIVARYLGLGRIVKVHSNQASCRMCPGSYGSADLTDGEWHWPEGLVHYLVRHDVRPDSAFVRWVLQRESAAAYY